MSTNMLTLLLTNQTFERGYQTLTFSVGKPRKTNNGMCYVVYGLIPTSVIWDLISRVKLNSQWGCYAPRAMLNLVSHE